MTTISDWLRNTDAETRAKVEAIANPSVAAAMRAYERERAAQAAADKAREDAYAAERKRLGVAAAQGIARARAETDWCPSKPLQDAEQPDAQASASAGTEAVSVVAGEGAKGIQKRVLVEKHIALWPTIRADLAGAATNGLSAAAKAGSRNWREAAALAWAKTNARLLGAPEQGTIDSVMRSGFTSHRHTLTG